MILARPAPNTPPARYQGCGRRRFNGAVKTHNKKPQLPLNGALRDSVRTRGVVWGKRRGPGWGGDTTLGFWGWGVVFEGGGGGKGDGSFGGGACFGGLGRRRWELPWGLGSGEEAPGSAGGSSWRRWNRRRKRRTFSTYLEIILKSRTIYTWKKAYCKMWRIKGHERTACPGTWPETRRLQRRARQPKPAPEAKASRKTSQPKTLLRHDKNLNVNSQIMKRRLCVRSRTKLRGRQNKHWEKDGLPSCSFKRQRFGQIHERGTGLNVSLVHAWTTICMWRGQVWIVNRAMYKQYNI